MAKHQKKPYLISYDIAHPKRLARTHRVLKKAGLPMQYSVFTVVLKQRRLEHLLAAIDLIIDPIEDDVRCYALPVDIQCATLGRQFFPDDVMLFSGGVNRLFG
ncbi:MAG: CRISPR-associated endonuclease Cas2 [Gammaproteobacteria bacterium]